MRHFTRRRVERWLRLMSSIGAASLVAQAVLIHMNRNFQVVTIEIPFPPSPENPDNQQSDTAEIHVDISALSKTSLRVLHVTKEFGQASMGGLGAIVDALAHHQSCDKSVPYRNVQIDIIMPHYKFMRVDTNRSVISEFVLHVPVGRQLFHWWESLSSDNVDQSLDTDMWPADQVVNVKITVLTPKLTNSGCSKVSQYWIGPGDRGLLQNAFQTASDSKHQIYYSCCGLEEEQQGLFFVKAATYLVAYLQPESRSKLIVHLHGATVGLVPLFYRMQTGAFEGPKFVYSLHDYSYEIVYSVLIRNFRMFAPWARLSENNDRIKRGQRRFSFDNIYRDEHGYVDFIRVCDIACWNDRLYPSSLAVILSSVAIFVSKTLKSKIMQKSIIFPKEQMEWSALREKDICGRFFGISNGVSFEDITPFNNSVLNRWNLSLTLPDYVHAVHEKSSFKRSILAQKQRAKEILVRDLKLLPASSEERPLALFVGRFHELKGLDVLIAAAPSIEELLAKDSGSVGVTILIVGQKNSIDMSQEIPSSSKVNFVVWEGVEIQMEALPLARLAADIVIVPSRSESFGLVAVEGLLHGSVVVSSGVGGLAEFLKPMQKSTLSCKATCQKSLWISSGNAYLFELSSSVDQSARLLAESLLRALVDLRNLLPKVLDAWRWSFVADALRLGWTAIHTRATSDGLLQDNIKESRLTFSPIQQYWMAYGRALSTDESF